jgi:hypothetical protein
VGEGGVGGQPDYGGGRLRSSRGAANQTMVQAEAACPPGSGGGLGRGPTKSGGQRSDQEPLRNAGLRGRLRDLALW